MKTYWETITPERASALLKLNTNNRPVRKLHTKNLARAMKQGDWVPNGDPIRFNCTLLLDGQHRLLACVESGCAFKTLIVEGLGAEVMPHIDEGRIVRSPGDYLALQGHKSTVALVAALGLTDRYYTSRTSEWVVYSTVEVSRLLEKYAEMPRSVNIGMGSPRFSPRSVVIAAHYITAQIDRDAADLFISQFKVGDNLDTGDPVFVLREKLMRELGTGIRGRDKQIYHLAYLMKAWNARRKGERVKVFKLVKGEPFPLAA